MYFHNQRRAAAPRCHARPGPAVMRVALQKRVAITLCTSRNVTTALLQNVVAWEREYVSQFSRQGVDTSIMECDRSWRFSTGWRV